MNVVILASVESFDSGKSRDLGESVILANLIMYGEFVDCVYSGILVNCVILVNLEILVSLVIFADFYTSGESGSLYESN